MIRQLVAFALAVQACWLAGCSEKPPALPATFPVTGIVHIDGKPAAGVKVMLFPADDLPADYNPLLGSAHMGTTDADGKFSITTYNLNDGAPPGDYVLSFYWAGSRGATRLGQDADEPRMDPAAARFSKKYGDPWKPEFKVSVKEGQPTDMGTLEMKTK